MASPKTPSSVIFKIGQKVIIQKRQNEWFEGEVTGMNVGTDGIRLYDVQLRDLLCVDTKLGKCPGETIRVPEQHVDFPPCGLAVELPLNQELLSAQVKKPPFHDPYEHLYTASEHWESMLVERYGRGNISLLHERAKSIDSRQKVNDGSLTNFRVKKIIDSLEKPISSDFISTEESTELVRMADKIQFVLLLEKLRNFPVKHVYGLYF